MEKHSDNIAIRPFKPEDAESCFRIRSEAFIREFYRELGPESVVAGVNAYMPKDYVSMSEKMSFFVAELESQPVGFCVIRLLDTTTAEIFLIYVQLDHLGKGIGTQLVRFSESFLKKRHPSILEMMVDTVIPEYNQAFYEKLGFMSVGEHTYEFPGRSVLAVRLKKSLEP